MKLYEIQSHILDVLENGFSVDEETGECFGIEELESLQLAFEEKAESIACYIKQLESETSAIKAEEKALAERRRLKENKVERLKSYLADCLKGAGKDKFETARCQVKFRKSESVEIDEGKFFEIYGTESDYVRAKYEPNKTAIKAALKQGQQVFGAVIVEQMNLGVK
jgi:chromosome segregation ATPase